MQKKWREICVWEMILPVGWPGSVRVHGGWECGRCLRLPARQPGAAGSIPCCLPRLWTPRTAAASAPRPFEAHTLIYCYFPNKTGKILLKHITRWYGSVERHPVLLFWMIAQYVSQSRGNGQLGSTGNAGYKLSSIIQADKVTDNAVWISAWNQFSRCSTGPRVGSVHMRKTPAEAVAWPSLWRDKGEEPHLHLKMS